jgi:O-antigen/teichoic acid export membrane protein
MKQILQKLARNNNLLSLGGNIAASGLGFLSFAILVRFLEKDVFGNWILFLTLATLTEMIRTGLLQTGLIKFMSGKNESVQKVVVGTGWVFSILTTLCIAAISLLGYWIIKDRVNTMGVVLFFKYFPILTFFSLPFNFATWYLQGQMRFRHLLFIRSIILVAFIGFVITFLGQLSLELVIWGYIIAQSICSVVCIVCKWTKIEYIKHAQRKYLKKLFNFGKYSMGTMIGANLLKNSDTLIIGAMINAEAVAYYSVPLKLFEITEVPLRSFVATALPYMSKLINSGEKGKISDFFERSAGMFTIILIPFVVLAIIFADPMVSILGGTGYSESANVFRVFALFALLMPIDRYSGVALDILNKPAFNFLKVIIMLAVNIVGDILVIYFTGKIFPVAVVSILTFTTGVYLGLNFLRRFVDFTKKGLIVKGFLECKMHIVNLLNKLKPEAN